MGDDPSGDIATALEPRLGPGLEIADIQPLTSGASRQSIRFDAAAPGQTPRRYVLQREMMPGLGATAPGDPGPLSMRAQAAVLDAARRAGVPVAAVVASGEMSGRHFIISEWLEGEALAQKLLRDPDLEEGRARLMEDCSRALAAIHQIPPSGLGLTQQDRLAVYRHRLDSIGEPRPVLELGYKWLAERRPSPATLSVVHGDFRLGNLLVDRTGLRAVLDWELAHLGDPHEDVAWATIRAWRFDRYRQPGTFPEPDAWAEAYNAAADRSRAINPEVMRWWQIAGTWSWAVISAMQARRHLDGWVQSLEHAVIGRRVCESEWDLLELLP
jgi:aminoglycoside phosphotransferase (APT) family kinase protein